MFMEMVRTSNTTTALRSVAGSGGAFDIPKEKCPPDGGSPACVTGKPAPLIAPFPQYAIHPYVPPVSVGVRESNASPIPITTPPLTPDNASTASSSFSSISSLELSTTPDLLTTLFPDAAVQAAPYAKAVTVSGEGVSFDGFVLDLPKDFLGGNRKCSLGRTLFVDGRGAEGVQLREGIVAMLDLADERLACEAFIIALEKSSPSFGSMLHSLMYVGGNVVTLPPFEADSSFVLVGIDM